MPSGEPHASAEPIRYAVVCAPGDASGPWLAAELRGRGIPARVVTTQELAYSTSLTHEVRRAGVTTRIRLADGSIFGPDLVGTVNRATVVPTAHLGGMSEGDRDYAAQELQATLLSLLHGLPGAVLGRPDPRGLSGAWWRQAEWMVESGRAGLTTDGYRRVVSNPSSDPAHAPHAQARTTEVVVIGGQVIATDVEVPVEVAQGCRLLAERHGGGILGVDFVVDTSPAADAHGWRCVGGTPLPDLRRAAGRTVDAVLAALDVSLVATEQVSA